MRRRVACELIKLVPQRSRDLHAVRPFGHSHIRGRVYCALHVLDDVVRWYRYRDREQVSIFLRESYPDAYVMINVNRLFGVTWVGAISILHAVFSLPSWRSRGSAGLFCSYCSASHSFIRSSIEHGRTRCMGTSILVIVLSLHNRLSIARAAFETRLLALYPVQFVNESYCKDDIYIPRG